MSDALNFLVNTVHTVLLKYFSSFAAVKIGKKKTLFLPIFTAAKDEKYFIQREKEIQLLSRGYDGRTWSLASTHYLDNIPGCHGKSEELQQ